MRKILMGLALVFLATLSQAQNGLEAIVVEKYYVSNATDNGGSVGDLPVGSVTYRVYLDMLPGYKFQAAYGLPGHELILSTTTAFFNNEDRGATTPSYTKSQARGNSVMLDSWFSVGAACSGSYGILKSEDNVAAGGATVVNNTSPIMLQNADPSAGIAISIQDGIYTTTPVPEAVTFVGFTPAELDVFDGTSNAGSSISTINASWASLNGSTGPIPSTNKVLIGQFTTDGVFSFELNIQIGTPSGGAENYVAKNPVGNEILFPGLLASYGGVNTPPTVSISSPANGASFLTGASIGITANAADVDGSVSQVEFFVNGVSIGVDNTAPTFTTTWIGTNGSKVLTAVATDNNGATTTSAPVTITVASNTPPVVSVSAPATAVVGDLVTFTATASDPGGSVASVEFFVNGASIGVVNSAPYTKTWTAVLGSFPITAKATDNLGDQTTSTPVTINVANNQAPTASITSPANLAAFTFPTNVVINANAADMDGTVTLVEFFVNGNLVGSDAGAPYTFTWTSVIGNATLLVRATDNKGAQSFSAPVAISIVDPNALPYSVAKLSGACSSTSLCLPVLAIDSVKNVIGYDIVLAFDKSKLTPTGIITVDNDLINPSFTDYATSIDIPNGLMYVSIFFNPSAPANTNFNGKGVLFCAEFNTAFNLANNDTADVSIPSLQESYFTGVVPQLVDAGEYTTFSDSIFTGSLRFWSNNSPIAYNSSNPSQFLITNIYGNDINCANQSAIAVQPDLNGNFNYSIGNGRTVNIQKDIAATTDVQPVINGFDALQIRKVLINDLTFIPNVYQAIAMDVNTDGFISSGDLSQVNQRTVLFIPEFKQAWNYNTNGVSNGQLSKDWLFVDTVKVVTDPSYTISATYPNNDGVGFSKAKVPVVTFCSPISIANQTTCTLITDATFKGILVGDVDGSFATATPNNLFRTSSFDKVIFDLSTSVIENGFVTVPVALVSSEDAFSLDFAMNFDQSKLAFNSTTSSSDDLQSLSNVNADDKTLRFTSYSLQPLENGKSLVAVKFATNGAEINAKDFTNVQAYINGERVGTEFLTSSTANGLEVNLFPNPAAGFVNVIASKEATLQVSDLSGRLVFAQTTLFAYEKQQLNTALLANGVYMVKISNNEFTTVKKLVVKN